MIRAAEPTRSIPRDGGAVTRPVTLARHLPFVGWLWLLGGLPAAVLLISSPPPVWIAFFTLAVFLEIGHAVSPIVFAWTNDRYRKLIFAHPRRYLVLPGAVLLTAFAIGAATSLGWTSFVRPARDFTGQSFAFTDVRNPFGLMVAIYWWWNIYHFGMQNFGVLALCRQGRGARPRRALLEVGRWQIRWPRPAAIACLALTAFGMAILPKLPHSDEVGIIAYSALYVNHWVVAVGLPAHVEASLAPSRPRLRAFGFVLGVLLLGGVGFVWTAPAWLWRAWGYAIPAHEPDFMLVNHVVPVLLSLRFGLSFVHFLYDRAIWKMSDPEVRAILAPALARAA